jgi:hypothetical protein
MQRTIGFAVFMVQTNCSFHEYYSLQYTLQYIRCSATKVKKYRYANCTKLYNTLSIAKLMYKALPVYKEKYLPALLCSWVPSEYARCRTAHMNMFLFFKRGNSPILCIHAHMNMCTHEIQVMNWTSEISLSMWWILLNIQCNEDSTHNSTLTWWSFHMVEVDHRVH